jgi:hypothetical protein
VSSMVSTPQRHSRYQVRASAAPAWTADDKGTLYRFDGLRFSRCRRKDGAFSVVPAWQTPCYGWVSLSECPLAAPAATARRASSPAAPQPHLAA